MQLRLKQWTADTSRVTDRQSCGTGSRRGPGARESPASSWFSDTWLLCWVEEAVKCAGLLWSALILYSSHLHTSSFVLIHILGNSSFFLLCFCFLGLLRRCGGNVEQLHIFSVEQILQTASKLQRKLTSPHSMLQKTAHHVTRVFISHETAKINT